ncbi:MAG TPA: LLM class flavin-dependent oxidoreductase [Hyphomicrobiaceae bacterium]|jgi:probable F420-dependent oxidoreductase|nr:LLM class flavin-dependent oxidoreductase [Hyphomicrobiaceae bacterium]
MTIAVGMGLMEYPFQDVSAYWRWVDLCEAGGVDSLWQTDRVVSSEPILECMTTMAALAGRTRRIKFGMNVVSLALRDPVLVAKQCATIDVLSNGRLLPAFGIGSPRAPEWAALNLDTGTRGRRTDEGLQIIGRLWREDKVDFAGVHYRLTGASIAPKPVQAELPIWIGGSSPAAIQRTARYGTGWQAGPETPAEAEGIVAAIRAASRQLGRVIEDDHYGAGFPFYFGQVGGPAVPQMMEAYRRRTGRDPANYFAVGDADTIVGRIGEYVAAGISKFVLRPLGADGAEVTAQTQRLIAEVLPQVASRWPKPPKAARL